MSRIPATGTPIVLESGKGTLSRLSAPAATVFVANPDIADVQVKSPELIYVSAKAPGETVVYAVDASSNVLLHSPVRVDRDLPRVRDSLRRLLPGENTNVSLVDNSVVLSGDVSTQGRTEKARARRVERPRCRRQGRNGRQSACRRHAEPGQSAPPDRRDKPHCAGKALGFNWQNLGESTLELSTQKPFTNQTISNQNLFQYGFGLTGADKLQAELDALASEGLITTLAEPNLTATSGQTASFLAGGEFPVPIAATSATPGTPTITVDFKTFGVELEFTPTIVDATHLRLKVRPEVSQLTSTGTVSVPITSTATVQIPAHIVRRAETTVDLVSGQSFALAGLVVNTIAQDISKVPWLGDLPILGQLFRSQLFQHHETELIIIVTPYLVRPAPTRLAAPTDDFVPPNDVQSFATASTPKQTLPPAGGW